PIVSKGNITGIAVFARDITERRQFLADLAERAQLATLARDVALVLTQEKTLPVILHRCTEALVEHLDAAFARIWTANQAQQVLELQASAGTYTHLNGPQSRVPFGHLKIGCMAVDRQPFFTNQVAAEPWIGDQTWAMREGMVAFVGHPLIVGG